MANGQGNIFKIGVICGKLGDVDGVSLEVDKWIKILLELGHEVYTISGKYSSTLTSIPKKNQLLLESIRFGSPEQNYYENLLFPHLQKYPPHLSEEKIKKIVTKLEIEGTDVALRLFEFVKDLNIDVIIAQNTNAMPMTLLGSMGVYKLATEQRVASIFHHHDFWWERSRFSHNHIESLLSKIMPPSDPGLEHIVLSSYSAHILRSLKRVHPKVIPNCEDFDNPVQRDSYNSDFRKQLGFRDSDILIVQPTRIVRRKRIEDSIEFVGRFLKKYPAYKASIQFIISLYQGDEPDKNYFNQIQLLAKDLEVPLHLISDRVSSERKNDADGRKIYTNRDVLANADIVTYLPVWEGFGNALLEAYAAKVPVINTDYLVYKTDIKIMGFNSIEIRDTYNDDGKLIIPERALDELDEVLSNPVKRKKMVERNFRIAKKEFGLKMLKKLLKEVFDDYSDEIRASRKRIQKSKKEYSV